MTEPESSPTLIGWRERIALPQWGIRSLRAKIDTGARTSAIDVPEIIELPDGRVRFKVVVSHDPTRKVRWVESEVARTSIIKPSSGERQERLVCRTPMVLAGIEREIEISLVCRKGMLCRMLVGRTALEGLFAVDPAARYLHNPAKKA
ncbi:ATP-dependent zinc protease family protein [Mucisphaera sp.]|uniref:ATP-dependent zinc protease family protein n=1 Tax=Mucisphaera sp. TaxID=2913024 RepID=UPI003D0D0C23